MVEVRQAHVRIPHFRDRLERLVDRVARPVLAGEISVEAFCSLEHVAREMDDLCEVGAYRRLSTDDLRARSMDARAVAYERSRTEARTIA